MTIIDVLGSVQAIRYQSNRMGLLAVAQHVKAFIALSEPDAEAHAR